MFGLPSLFDEQAWLAQGTALLQNYGLVGLFLVCFFSASLLPFPSEPIIIIAAKFFDPFSIMLVVLVSSTMAAYINYLVGFKGLHPFILKREEREEHKAEKWIRKWGAPILVASPWIPFIGDLFPVAAGTLKMPPRTFLFWIIIARIVKTLGVLAFAYGLFKLLGW